MELMPKKRHAALLTIAIHLLGWGLLLVFPLLMRWQNREETVTLSWYLGYIAVPLSCMVVFYANYLLLIPRILFRKSWSRFILLNILLVIVVWYAGRLWWDFYVANLADAIPRPPKKDRDLPHLMFFARDMMSYALTVALAVAAGSRANASATKPNGGAAKPNWPI